MVLHVVSNHLDASVLSGLDIALTLTEDYVWLQNVLSLLNNSSCGRTSLAVSELLLQVSDGLSISSDLAVLSVVVSAELVDLTIQSIDLSLVAELCLSEVVSTVAVAELVVETSLDSEVRIAQVVLHRSISCRSNSTNPESKKAQCRAAKP